MAHAHIELPTVKVGYGCRNCGAVVVLPCRVRIRTCADEQCTDTVNTHQHTISDLAPEWRWAFQDWARAHVGPYEVAQVMIQQ